MKLCCSYVVLCGICKKTGSGLDSLKLATVKPYWGLVKANHNNSMTWRHHD